MSVKGDLQDVGLPSLIQMICTDQHQAALLLRHRQMEEGVLFFADGEIVHARTGRLIGEDAVYHLLEWEDGTFTLGHNVRVPRRTVHAPWRHLLLEGMKQVDERNAAATAHTAAPAPPTAEQKTADETLEGDLIMLLSQLEYHRAAINDTKRPADVLHKLTTLVNEALDFTARQSTTADFRLEDALTRATAEQPATRLVSTENGRLQPTTADSLYRSWTGRLDARQKIFTEISSGLLHLLQSVFTAVCAGFYTGAMADQWRDTCHVFWTDLQTAVQRTRF